MERFPTLEEFLLLQDDDLKPPSTAHRQNMSPECWVKYYKSAKANWERFGDTGPSVGMEVITLIVGHGGSENCARTIVHKNTEDKWPHFVLIRKDGNRSLVKLRMWWLDITVREFSPFNPRYGWT